MEINEHQLLNRKHAVYALRNTPQTERCSSVLVNERNQVCALGLIARELGVLDATVPDATALDCGSGSLRVEGRYSTYKAKNLLSDMLGLDHDELQGIVSRNDGRKPYQYSWNQIADYIEGL